MKRILPIYLLLGISASGQNVVFEDANFKKAVINSTAKPDLNEDGEISEEEAKRVTSLRLQSLYAGDKDIFSSIKGIEKFINLTELNIGKHHISSVDLSQNTKLKTLNLRDNKLIGRLDISHLGELTNVELNGNKIEEVILPNTGKIVFLYLNDNNIRSIDVSQQKALRRFFMVRNKELSNIDISQNTNLERVHLEGNSLETLDISNLEKLTWLNVVKNKLNQIIVKNNKVLATILANENNIKSLNLQDGTLNTISTLNLKDNPIEEILKDCNDKLGANLLEPKEVQIKDNCTLSNNDFNYLSIKIVNPIKDKLMILGNEIIRDIKIYNSIGQLVGQSSDVSALQKGIYFVKILTDKGEYQQKMVKE